MDRLGFGGVISQQPFRPPLPPATPATVQAEGEAPPLPCRAPGSPSAPSCAARFSRPPWSATAVPLLAVPLLPSLAVSLRRRAIRAHRLQRHAISKSHISPLDCAEVLDSSFVGVGSRRVGLIGRQVKLSKALRCAGDESDDGGGDMESTDMSFLQKLIQKQREATEIGICTEDWHPELFDEVPEGYRDALEAGVDLVDVLANSSALKLLASTPAKGQPRFSIRVAPKPTLGLGYIVHRSVVQHYAVLSPLQQTMKRLSVGEIETLTIHSLGQGRMHFPFWVYDAVVEAYQKGLCSRIGVSHPNADIKSVLQARQELERRGASLSCVFVKLSLLQREATQLVKACRDEGLQVFATEVLGPEELASGRYTAANPTGGEISVPRFTLAQLMPLRPLHDALEEVARGLRSRCEKPEIDTTQVALQWVVSKGASPLCDVTTTNNAKAVAGCKGPDGWKLTPEEEARLDEAADEVAKTRRRW
ncbi:PLR1 [Symbiodinium natans]|uniref:PLR1 protein n=1 Tax=Symbiodinium natans TaxID=878477 RepID=A0A812KYJ9_9DINO|nr:PLR1 [Symbiodinium natans]